MGVFVVFVVFVIFVLAFDIIFLYIIGVIVIAFVVIVVELHLVSSSSRVVVLLVALAIAIAIAECQGKSCEAVVLAPIKFWCTSFFLLVDGQRRHAHHSRNACTILCTAMLFEKMAQPGGASTGNSIGKCCRRCRCAVVFACCSNLLEVQT